MISSHLEEPIVQELPDGHIIQIRLIKPSIAELVFLNRDGEEIKPPPEYSIEAKDSREILLPQGSKYLLTWRFGYVLFKDDEEVLSLGRPADMGFDSIPPFADIHVE